MGQAILELAFIFHSFIDVSKWAIATKSGIDEISFVNWSVRVNVNSSPVCIALHKIAWVVAPILENGDSPAVGITFLILALICGVVFADTIDGALHRLVVGKGVSIEEFV